MTENRHLKQKNARVTQRALVAEKALVAENASASGKELVTAEGLVHHTKGIGYRRRP